MRKNEEDDFGIDYWPSMCNKHITQFSNLHSNAAYEICHDTFDILQ